MADEFSLTGGLVTVSSPSMQEVMRALDVSAYDEADLLLHVPHLEGTDGPELQVRILTGMHLTGEGWVVVGTFTTVDDTGEAFILNIKNFLKYIRWEVSLLDGTNPKATFCICGMLRHW